MFNKKDKCKSNLTIDNNKSNSEQYVQHKYNINFKKALTSYFEMIFYNENVFYSHMQMHSLHTLKLIPQAKVPQEE